ncbi:MAG TPA: L,D-transpeptidase, partial [Xanthobacteraceae bacterium]|nr:L,D-transpeptidase [Xanthobacteraceae bacterium]
MTATAALLTGLATSANAVPLNMQPGSAPLPDAARSAKPKATVLASRDKASTKPKESEDLAARAKGVLTVVVSISKQQLTLYSDGRPIAHSRVSTGVPGHATPTGVFSVIQKDRWHHSNIYSNAPMYFMQRITWSGVAMHQGVVPNGPASHGCIRLPEAFARQMWGITKLGARVIVTYGDVTPVAIANDRLFTFKPEVKPEPTPQPEASSADKIKAAYGILETAQLQTGIGNTTASDASKSPWDAAKPGDRALDAMAYAVGAPRETAVTASDPKPAAAAGTSRVANTATNTTVDELRPLKPGPVSVFISRKEGKLFVRKGFEPVFDVPVTFEQPDQPLGTHVFTALALNDDNTTLRWNVMSMPGGASAPAKKAEKGKKVEVAVTTPASNATDALNRVNIPQDAIERISRLMSPGASLIISDKGISG